jgi:hypothetical protein
MLSETARAFIAHDMAAIAWAQVAGFMEAGKIQGDLTREEFMNRIELVFREALDVPNEARPEPHQSRKR